MYRQRSSLLNDRTIAYHALMEKYIEEKKVREKVSADIIKMKLQVETLTKSPTMFSKTLFDRILDYYEKEQPYLNPKLKINEIAEMFNTTQREISEVLSAKAGCNFNVFTNKYRVKEARRLFEDPNFNQLKMGVIAAKSGFGTIQSFYNAFELNTGVKPAYYRMHIN